MIVVVQKWHRTSLLTYCHLDVSVFVCYSSIKEGPNKLAKSIATQPSLVNNTYQPPPHSHRPNGASACQHSHSSMSMESGIIRRSSRRGAKKRVYAVGDFVVIHDVSILVRFFIIIDRPSCVSVSSGRANPAGVRQGIAAATWRNKISMNHEWWMNSNIQQSMSASTTNIITHTHQYELLSGTTRVLFLIFQTRLENDGSSLPRTSC